MDPPIFGVVKADPSVSPETSTAHLVKLSFLFGHFDFIFLE